MKFITSKADHNISMRLFSREEVKKEILKFRNTNKGSVGVTPCVACPAESWDEVIVLAVLTARATNMGLSIFYYDEQKQILFICCDWFNKDHSMLKHACIDVLKKYLANPKLSTILYDANGDPLFTESQETMNKFIKDLPDTPDDFNTFSNFPSSGMSDGIKILSKFDILNPSRMEIM